VVIPNAVDVRAAPQSELLGAPPTIITVGRFNAPKDPLTLVGALTQLAPGSFRATLVGDGPDRAAVAAAVRQAGLDRTVELTGERHDVPALLAGADMFVLSSLSEGLPISVLEAMAAGLPVVASAVGDVPEAVADGKSGLLVPPGDPAALAGALRRLLADADLRRRFGAAARERALELFDLPRFQEAHVRLYGDLLSGGRP
jgi:glycosyltransferase involved in cell wall biosynthesis